MLLLLDRFSFLNLENFHIRYLINVRTSLCLIGNLFNSSPHPSDHSNPLTLGLNLLSVCFLHPFSGTLFWTLFECLQWTLMFIILIIFFECFLSCFPDLHLILLPSLVSDHLRPLRWFQSPRECLRDTRTQPVPLHPLLFYISEIDPFILFLADDLTSNEPPQSACVLPAGLYDLLIVYRWLLE